MATQGQMDRRVRLLIGGRNQRLLEIQLRRNRIWFLTWNRDLGSLLELRSWLIAWRGDVETRMNDFDVAVSPGWDVSSLGVNCRGEYRSSKGRVVFWDEWASSFSGSKFGRKEGPTKQSCEYVRHESGTSLAFYPDDGWIHTRGNKAYWWVFILSPDERRMDSSTSTRRGGWEIVFARWILFHSWLFLLHPSIDIEEDEGNEGGAYLYFCISVSLFLIIGILRWGFPFFRYFLSFPAAHIHVLALRLQMLSWSA